MGPRSLVEVRLAGLALAFALPDVRRVVRAVAVTPVPGAPGCLLGLIVVHGTPVPLYDLRRMLGLPTRALQLDDRFLIAGEEGDQRAFVVDAVTGATEAQEAGAPASQAMAAAGVRGLARRGDGLLVIHDVRRFMAHESAQVLHPHD